MLKNSEVYIKTTRTPDGGLYIERALCTERPGYHGYSAHLFARDIARHDPFQRARQIERATLDESEA